MTLHCERCGESFSSDHGHTGIYFAEGATSLEQAKTAKAVYLCPRCAGELRGWLRPYDDQEDFATVEIPELVDQVQIADLDLG